VQYDNSVGSRTARLSLCYCNILQLTAADNVGLTCISVYFRNWTKWKQRQQQRQQPDEGSRHVSGLPSLIISLLSSLESVFMFWIFPENEVDVGSCLM
jgi:uncharacterized membrane protein